MHQLGERLFADLLLAGAKFFARRHLGLSGPVLVVERPREEAFNRAEFFDGLVEGASFIHVVGADEEAHVLPREVFELLGDLTHRLGDGLGLRGAIHAEEVAALQPHDLPSAEEGEGLQSFAETSEGFQRLAGIGNLAVDGFMIHAAKFLGPLLE